MIELTLFKFENLPAYMRSTMHAAPQVSYQGPPLLSPHSISEILVEHTPGGGCLPFRGCRVGRGPAQNVPSTLFSDNVLVGGAAEDF